MLSVAIARDYRTRIREGRTDEHFKSFEEKYEHNNMYHIIVGIFILCHD